MRDSCYACASSQVKKKKKKRMERGEKAEIILKCQAYRSSMERRRDEENTRIQRQKNF